ncbi:MAG: hypothetical protein GY759_10070 [Chloroflexi bacterium]|nr:hypothetical protein [Chloroflexota bacterium]
MSTWITDRLPCHADIDADGYVLVPTRSSDERTSIWQHAVEVKLGDPWLPAPPAYDPSPTREELVQELLDAVDAFNGMDGSCEWTDVMDARENLK